MNICSAAVRKMSSRSLPKRRRKAGPEGAAEIERIWRAKIISGLDCDEKPPFFYEILPHSFLAYVYTIPGSSCADTKNISERVSFTHKTPNSDRFELCRSDAALLRS